MLLSLFGVMSPPLHEGLQLLIRQSADLRFFLLPHLGVEFTEGIDLGTHATALGEEDLHLADQSRSSCQQGVVPFTETPEFRQCLCYTSYRHLPPFIASKPGGFSCITNVGSGKQCYTCPLQSRSPLTLANEALRACASSAVRSLG